MTAPPKYFQLTPKNPSVDGGRPARSLGRARQIYLDVYHVIPTVETWPYATDGNGQGYPAGTVGVRFAWHPGLDDSLEVNASADFYALVPVPASLPAGYTTRLVREHFYNPGSGGNSFGQAWPGQGFQPTPPYHGGAFTRIRLADGLHDYWASLPEARGDGAYSQTISTSGWGNYPVAGLRYVRWQGVQPGITVELRCNANGSTTGTGDTSLALYTNGGGAPANSPLFTAGLQFGLGVKRFLYWKTNPVPPSPIPLIAGARVDLPLPFLTSGPSIVVPGGYVAAKLDALPPT